jgi:hypothetical protein
MKGDNLVTTHKLDYESFSPNTFRMALMFIRFQQLFSIAQGNRSTPGISVSIVSGYGLDDRVIEVRSPAEAKQFSSSLCVQTSSVAHAASCTMGTGGPFPGAKARPGHDADHSPPSSAEVDNE